jgi:transcription initiation factor TFIID subunit 7
MDPIAVDEAMGSEEESAKEQANDDDLFAQELEKALQGDSEDEDEDDDDEDDEDGAEGAEEGDDDDDDDDDDDESVSGSGTDEDEDDEEYSGAKKVLDDEIKQLETAINKKNQDIAAVQHVALKVLHPLSPVIIRELTYVL